jgi:hypothetical protein
MMGLETDKDLADALYYCLMACAGHGAGLRDKFSANIEQYEAATGATLDTSPIHADGFMDGFSDLAWENLETPDPEFAVFENGVVLEGKFWTAEAAEAWLADFGTGKETMEVRQVLPESDPNDALEKVDGPFGAPMGRPDITGKPEDATHVSVAIFRVALVDGDYDRGGAYWGGGGQPLWCIHGDDFRIFRRAGNAIQARQFALAEFPYISFID